MVLKKPGWLGILDFHWLNNGRILKMYLENSIAIPSFLDTLCKFRCLWLSQAVAVHPSDLSERTLAIRLRA